MYLSLGIANQCVSMICYDLRSLQRKCIIHIPIAFQTIFSTNCKICLYHEVLTKCPRYFGEWRNFVMINETDRDLYDTMV